MSLWLNICAWRLPRCQLVCFWVPPGHSCPKPQGSAGMVLCKGETGMSVGGKTGGCGSSDERGVQEWVSQGREEKRKPKKMAGGGMGWEMVSGSWISINSCLGAGRSLCTLFFFILSGYSCWDTASTSSHARISSSSLSFGPKAEGISAK